MMLGRLTGHGVPPHARHTAHTTARAAAVYNLVFLLTITAVYNRAPHDLTHSLYSFCCFFERTS